MKLRKSVDPIALVLSIVMGLQLIIIGLYTGLLFWPFYYNGLHMRPAAEVASGYFDPKWYVPFCYTHPDASGDYYAHCVDDAEGNSNGGGLLFAARLIAFWGPFLLILLGILVGVFLFREWSAFRFSARVIGLVYLMVTLASFGFLGVTRLGPLLLVWIQD
ncbi:MAG: hypothetical protein JW918_08735 [Anaerolineae bacterium]|nr:hypothetical protein [Anaerolineae bacterium]